MARLRPAEGHAGFSQRPSAVRRPRLPRHLALCKQLLPTAERGHRHARPALRLDWRRIRAILLTHAHGDHYSNDDIKRVKLAIVKEVEQLREAVREKESRDGAKVDKLSQQVAVLKGELQSARTESERDGLTGVLNRRTFDRFRNRVMIPIHDGKVRPIGFGARALKAGDEPKYLNSPETALFHKGRELYGLYETRQARQREPGVTVSVRKRRQNPLFCPQCLAVLCSKFR